METIGWLYSMSQHLDHNGNVCCVVGEFQFQLVGFISGPNFKQFHVDHLHQITMGIIDKNYLNKVSNQIKDELKNQPCGCDCNCRPKFEDNGTPVPPTCNCRLNTNQIVGDWNDGRGALNTGFLYLPMNGVQNCPFDLTFSWTNLTFVILPIVTLKTSTQVITMTEGVQYTITLNPGDWYMFIFAANTQQPFDQYMTIQCYNNTCAESYGDVGSYTYIAI